MSAVKVAKKVEWGDLLGALQDATRVAKREFVVVVVGLFCEGKRMLAALLALVSAKSELIDYVFDRLEGEEERQVVAIWHEMVGPIPA